MPYDISKVDVYAGTIQDRPGGLADKLEPLAQAGAGLDFVIARRSPDNPGMGVVFVAPIKGAAQVRAAKNLGMEKTDSLHSLRMEGPDKPGLGARITRALSEAGVNMRGLSAAAIGRKMVVYFAFDTSDDAKKATKVLKAIK
ncbi:ACT domain-containing protein [bacterium]|nr:ACT domain-containing protein [bacterium]